MRGGDFTLEKMKKRMKNEKGFTLVELLAVIVILGIILAITIPSVGGIISNAKKDTHDANMGLFENAARLYYVSGNSANEVSLNKLEEEGYLEEIPENPTTDSLYDSSKKVKNTDGKDFTYEDRSTSDLAE